MKPKIVLGTPTNKLEISEYESCNVDVLRQGVELIRAYNPGDQTLVRLVQQLPANGWMVEVVSSEGVIARARVTGCMFVIGQNSNFGTVERLFAQGTLELPEQSEASLL